MTAQVDDPRVFARMGGEVASRWRPLAVGAVVAAGAVAVVLRDPHVPGSFGVCPVYALTGMYCAGCGALRATHDLLTGDLAGAWSMNPLWVVAVPLLVLAWLRWLRGPVPAGRWGRARSESAGRPAWAPSAVSAPSVRSARRRDRARVVLLPVLVGLTVVLYSVLRNVPALAGALAPGQ